MYNAGGSRDIFFYIHPLILAGGLSILWFRFRKYLTGNIIMQGLEFGLIYGIVALGPIIFLVDLWHSTSMYCRGSFFLA
jgi:hypothetical protein